MASRNLHLLSFFIFNIMVNTCETILAFIKGAGLIQCCHPLWGYMTIAIPFLPGIVGVPWFLWQAYHKKRGCGDATWAIVKWLAFPIMMFVGNIRRFWKLCHLQGPNQPESRARLRGPNEPESPTHLQGQKEPESPARIRKAEKIVIRDKSQS